MVKANVENNASLFTVDIVPPCYIHVLCFAYVQWRSYAYVKNAVIHLHYPRQLFCVILITAS